MPRNYVDHVFGSELDQLLAANQIAKRVARPKRQTKSRQWCGLSLKSGKTDSDTPMFGAPRALRIRASAS